MQMVSIYSLDIADMHTSSPRTIALPSLSTAGSTTWGGTFIDCGFRYFGRDLHYPQSVSVVCKVDADIKSISSRTNGYFISDLWCICCI